MIKRMIKKFASIDPNIFVLISIMLLTYTVYLVHLNTEAIFRELEMIALTLGHFCNE